MGLNIDANKALYLSGYTGKFQNSLKDIIKFANKDKNITDIRELAYILATAKIESGYSLQRWEADFVCGKTGIPYFSQPCQAALDYYRSTSGKKDYYTLGTDPKGLPYFGRGLIQLTGKANYEAYAKRLGIDLVNNPDLALKPKNSYAIAVSYMKNRGTFAKVLKNDLYGARRTIGSGGKTNEVNSAYNMWLKVLKNSEKKNLFIFTIKDKNTGETKTFDARPLAITLGVAMAVGIGVVLYKKLKR